jgi:pimeloyl-ACP methyl ester carboxylesterase
MSQFLLRDGRTLDLLDNHHKSETAVLFHHGTPGNSTSWNDWVEEFSGGPIRAIAASRPGYSQSDRHRGRRVVDVLDDLSQVLDQGEIKRFVSVGWSGGGPHALAMSFDERCVGVITLAGVGQYSQPDLDFLDGMGPENIDEFGIALQGEDLLRTWMNANALEMQHVTGEGLRETFGGLVGKADKEILSGDFAEDMAAGMRRALSRGFDGWIDDDLAFVQEWGFDLSAIDIPVQIWQGDDDLMVPYSHSRWLASKIPTSELIFIPENGHISLVVNHHEKIITQINHLLEGDK